MYLHSPCQHAPPVVRRLAGTVFFVAAFVAPIKGAPVDAEDLRGQILGQLSERLTDTGYAVKCTPFGYFCEWNLDVHGESLAKVWKEI